MITITKAMFISGYHEKNSNVIHLFFRTEERKKEEVIIDDFKPYFYVEFKDGKYFSLTKKQLEKVFCDYPEEVVKRREGYKNTYESDIPFLLRYLIDKEILSYVELPSLKPLNEVVNIKPRLVYVDIENVDEKMIAWTLWDSYTNTYYTTVLSDWNEIKNKKNHIVIFVENEYDLVKMLNYVVNTLNPDVFGGWNVAYDIIFIKNRFKYFGLKYNFASSDYFDMYTAYIRLFKPMSTRLKDVAIDEGLCEDPIEWDDAYEAWKSGDYDTMVKYNFSDVMYCVEIDKNKKIFDFFWSIKQFVGSDKLYSSEDYKILSTGTMVDILALRFAKKMGMVLPRMGYAEQIPYEGAYVVDPIPGRHKNLAVFDFARTYPSIIIALNISPETKIKDKDGNIYFDKSKKGLLPLICEYLLNERNTIEAKMKKYEPYSEKWKILKQMRDVVKFATNAVYGYVGWMHSRVYDVDCASTITSVARDLIMYCVNYTKEELGLETVYGDTDSTIVRIDWIDSFNEDYLPNLIEIGKKQTRAVTDYFKKKYKAKGEMLMKFERFASMGFFPNVKKRYALRVIWEDKPCDVIVIKGFEAIRTDTSKFARNFLRKFFEMLLDENTTDDEIRNYVTKSINEFKKQSLEDIAMRKGLNKDFDEYKGNQDFIRAALYSNKYLGTNFCKGSKVKFINVKGVKGLPYTDVVAFEYEKQIKDKVIVDYDKLIHRQIIRPIEDILKQIGIFSIKYKYRKFSNLARS